MQDFLFLLAFYYGCDLAVIENRLSGSELAACLAAYETVKLSFLTDEERDAFATLSLAERLPLSQTGYLRFKAWERDNSGIVAELHPNRALALN